MTEPPGPAKSFWKKYRKKIIFGLFAWLVLVALVQRFKPLPLGVNVSGQAHLLQADDVQFLTDVTYTDPQGQRVVKQQIMDQMLAMIKNAEQFLLLDLFLFNDHLGEAPEPYRNLCDELSQALILKKKQNPALKIVFITDPINQTYGADPLPQLEALKQAGVQVVVTDLTRLRDSNVLWSSPWRTFFQWFGNGSAGLTPHPFASEKKVSLRTWLRLANFKANHRKLVLADHQGQYWNTLVMSANPHDGSSAHGNVGLLVRGSLAHDAYFSESGIAAFSGLEMPENLPELSDPISGPSAKNVFSANLVTEKAILGRLLKEINRTEKGDRVDVAMFYFSHRQVVKALVKAAGRGVQVRLILDPNKDAFGRQKGGIPNRQVAFELLKKTRGNLSVRWYDTRGEQFHAKLLLVRRKKGDSHLLLGSANFTRRNLDNFNLEANVALDMSQGGSLEIEVSQWFEDLWSNHLGSATLDFSAYQDDRLGRKMMYRVMEPTGLCTF